MILIFRYFCSVFLVTVCGWNLQISSAQDSLLFHKIILKADSFHGVQPDTSFYYAQKALKLAEKVGQIQHLSIANQRLGRSYVQKEDFTKATNCFLEALRIEEKRNDKGRIADLNDDLGYIFMIMEKFGRSLSFYYRSYKAYVQLNDSAGIAKTLSHIGGLYMSREFCQPRSQAQREFDNYIAIGYYEKSLAISQKIHDSVRIAKNYSNLSVSYNKLKQPEKAHFYILKAIDCYRRIDDKGGLTGTLRVLGRVYNEMREYQKSIDSYVQCIVESKKQGMTQGIQYVYEELSQVYDNAGDYKNARNYYVKYMILRDSIYNSEKSNQIFELDAKYQTEKRENLILGLTLQKKKRDLFIYILLFIVVVLFFLYWNFLAERKITKQQLMLKEQEIRELEKDRQLLATQSVLKGEETERSRLARDLHDGLGGLLSGVKLSLSSMKGNLMLRTENVEKFDHAIGLLDSSIKELRRVAHNMMPETLVKYGLKEALSDFCKSINSDNTQTNFMFYGVEKRVHSNYEIHTFRVAQELANNALKHAKASEILVQLIMEENRLNLIVQDNGVGFDTSLLASSKGNGISNIKSRVESVNGRYDLFSKPGSGTEVSVEFTW